MNRSKFQWCLIATMMSLLAVSLWAAEDNKDEDQQEKPKMPSLEQIEDVEGLPRVLLIGDSISMGYTLPVRELLKDKANVHRPPTNCGSTRSGVIHLEAWLGDKPWDVIHFNFGLHDLKYLKDDKQNVPPDAYESNMKKLVDRLKKTGATVIFATTTPVPENVRATPYRRVPSDAPKYNDIALKVMADGGVSVDDLYSYILPKVDEYQIKEDVHFHKEGYEYMAQQIAQSIQAALDARSKE